jgi:hypothetical protein
MAFQRNSTTSTKPLSATLPSMPASRPLIVSTVIFNPTYVRCPTLSDRSPYTAALRAKPTSLGTLSRGSPAAFRDTAFTFSAVSLELRVLALALPSLSLNFLATEAAAFRFATSPAPCLLSSEAWTAAWSSLFHEQGLFFFSSAAGPRGGSGSP